MPSNPPPQITPRARRQVRFTRAPTPIRFRLTNRDTAILRWIARYRFLSSRQIARLDGGSHQNVRRRLRLLFDAGCVDRPQAQIAQLAHVRDVGNWPLTYGLGKEGARLLAELGDRVNDKLDWQHKNRATALFIAHTLETADAMIAFDFACRLHGDLRLVDHHDLLPHMPHATQAMKHPFSCRVLAAHPETRAPVSITVVPDRLFSIVRPDRTRHNFALELDRGTMDIKARQFIGKSSFRRKLIGYWQAWRQERHEALWGFRSFLVVTIPPSEAPSAPIMAEQNAPASAHSVSFAW